MRGSLRGVTAAARSPFWGHARAGHDRSQARPRPRGPPEPPLDPPHPARARRHPAGARARQRLRAASGDDPRARGRSDARGARARPRARRPPLHGVVPGQRAQRPEEGDPRPRSGLGQRDAGQLAQPAAALGGQPRREARARSRTRPGGPRLRPVHRVPGKPDDRRHTAPERRALRRPESPRRGPAHAHGVSLMDVVIRAALTFLFVFLLTRIVGRRELSSMEPFDVIMLVVLGDLVQQGITQSDYSLTGVWLAAGTLALMTVAVSYVSFRFRQARVVLEGDPIVLVESGKGIEHNLKRERLTVEEVAAEARLVQIESLDDVEWAILETSGKISFLQTQA